MPKTFVHVNLLALCLPKLSKRPTSLPQSSTNPSDTTGFVFWEYMPCSWELAKHAITSICILWLLCSLGCWKGEGDETGSRIGTSVARMRGGHNADSKTRSNCVKTSCDSLGPLEFIQTQWLLIGPTVSPSFYRLVELAGDLSVWSSVSSSFSPTSKNAHSLSPSGGRSVNLSAHIMTGPSACFLAYLCIYLSV